MTSSARTTAIIPTAGLSERRESLLAAIDSVQSQAGASVVPLVVANGPRVDAALLDELAARPGLRLLRREPAGVCAARRAGRDAVDTEFFCFLDDDDIYLPGAIAARLPPLMTDPDIDVVVGNGFKAFRNQRLMVANPADFAANAADPAGRLLEYNWLASCAGLYRTRTVPAELFEPAEAHHEWTLLAFRLALTRRIAFVPEPTYCINDTPDSLSKNPAHDWATVDVLKRMLALEMPAPVRRRVRRRLGAALHTRASRCLLEGRAREAWRWHLQSLAEPGGLARYGAFTRKLLWPRI